MACEILRRFPRLKNELYREPIIPEPTPVHSLASLGRYWGNSEVYVKREDRTHGIYGGNKVRNLEFVLGDARRRHAKRLLTLVPYGSNFTAALSVHGSRIGMEVHLAQFIAQRNPQIDEHESFCREHRARIANYDGLWGPVAAAASAGQTYARGSLSGEVYWVAPGASNELGAMGHTNAFLELDRQVREGLIPAPDVILVGAGTCGTLAGLSAGALLSGSDVRFLGVRCAEKVVCHPRKVRQLASAVVHRITGEKPSAVDNFEIVEVPTRTRYAVPCPESFEVMNAFWEREGISLDTTYTSKVALYLHRAMLAGRFAGKRVLYWHTYSPAVTCWSTERIRSLLAPVSKPKEKRLA